MELPHVLLRLLLLPTTLALVGAASDGKDRGKPPPGPPPPPPPLPDFQFSPTFGDDMVLQMAPAASAVYGFTGEGGTAVSVSVSSAGKVLYTVNATLNSTQQPFGASWGERPNAAGGCFNPWCKPLATWKALLKPTAAGGSYTIIATCKGCTGNTTAEITSATFGDVWHCSGQSNMWFPVQKTYSRNETVAAIQSGKYTNIHLMAGNSGTAPHGPTGSATAGESWPPLYGAKGGSNPWMTAVQAISDGTSSGLEGGNMSLFKMGATCWYFAQRLAELGVDHPIGLVNTAIGGQRIEEYMSNSSIATCHNRSSPGAFDGTLFGQQILPFVDMTVKGWLWYQGENNMQGRKGNGAANEGYSCNQRMLVEGWREVWSTTPGTTDPKAPFGIVTLASSGSEGGPNMGAMRQAQTAGYGVLPPPEGGTGLDNTFFAQAYDLDDQWGGPSWGRMACHHNNEGKPCLEGPFHQPCFLEWACCPVGSGVKNYNATKSKVTCNSTRAKLCTNACAASAGTPEYMGGIHPRSKKPVGDRLGAAAYNTVYGGKKAYTGPTLAGCTLGAADSLIIDFNTSAALSGDTPLQLKPIKPAVALTGLKTIGKYGSPIYYTEHSWAPAPSRFAAEGASYGGSTLYVQTNASLFCMEAVPAAYNETTGQPLPDLYYCPTWAGGLGPSFVLNTSSENTQRGGHFNNQSRGFNTGWVELDFVAHGTSSIKVDLTPLKGKKPTAVRYAWGIYDCCDLTDPLLWVTHPCIAECPIYSADGLFPANPFMAKIEGDKCECVAPQVCS